MNENLQTTLTNLLQSDTNSNSALNSLISDYAKYHVVLVVVGGLFLVGLTLLSIFFWKRFKKIPRPESRKWPFEKKTYLVFGLLTIVLSLFMLLIVAANASSALNPKQGFTGSISMLGNPKPGTQTYELQQSVNSWLQSSNATIPTALQNKVDERLAWQRPKAIICTVLLAIFLALSAYIWRSLIRESRVRESKWKLKDIVLFILGISVIITCLLLMLMVIGNIQGSFAPISLTLFFS